MKKGMKFLALLVLIFFFINFVLVAAQTTTQEETTTQQQIATTQPTQQSYSATFNLNASKLDLAADCINKKAGNCVSLSIPEIAFTILARPAANVSDACIKVLKSRLINNECFGTSSCSIKDTGLAILALDSVGEDTSKAEEWLVNRSRVSRELNWILELDTDLGLEMACTIGYRGNEYKVNMMADKKFDADAGPCLTRENNGLWLKISDSCYDADFAVTCDQNFKSVILGYDPVENKFLVPLTKEGAAFATVTQKVNAKCLSTSSTCTYEDNLWAVLALYKKGKDVSEYLPYLKTLSDKNKKYLPNSFLYMVTGDETDGNALVKEQRLGNYWEADGTPYNRFYDTALGLLALTGTSQDIISATQGRMIFSQDGKTGCWNNNLRDSAILLWALKGWHSAGGPGPGPGPGPGIEDCIDSGFYCLQREECAQNDMLDNYQCLGIKVCCRNQILKTCEAEGGNKCNTDETCTGLEKDSLDGPCCLSPGICEKIVSAPQCEQEGNTCQDSCLTNTEREVDMECAEAGKVCCEVVSAPSPAPKPKSLLWLWILLIILIILLILAIIFRDKVKLWIFKIKSKFKKEPKKPVTPPPAPMARPGFPPIRRPVPILPPRRPVPPPVHPVVKTYTSVKETKTTTKPAGKEKMDEVFKKLKEMSK